MSGMAGEFNQSSEPTYGMSEGTSQAEPQQPSNVMDELAQYAPPDLLDRVRSGVMMNQDYTRKTQELAEMRRATENERQQAYNLLSMALSSQNQAPAQLSHLDKTWQDLTKGEDRPEFDPVKQLLGAQKQDVASEIQRTVAPLQQQLAVYQAREAFGQLYDATIKPQYGQHLDGVWKEATDVALNYLQRGQVVDPLTIIAQYAPDKLRDAALKQAQGSSQNNTGLLSEGMVNTRTQQPIVGVGQTGNAGPADSTENILREAMSMMRGRPSA